ncbi:unnamed protein product [Cuscuta campestris]|uniref:Uncharacterized protein n=1 Tax=Cuscuta campestris TaxID=132261 RepID=A0A484K3L7_9ASTE|nr:unnamed protein product [Cuscuta campestris]
MKMISFEESHRSLNSLEPPLTRKSSTAAREICEELIPITVCESLPARVHSSSAEKHYGWGTFVETA